jgi:hypothetical protein
MAHSNFQGDVMKPIVVIAALFASALGYSGAAHAYSQEEVNMFAPPEDMAKSTVAQTAPAVDATKGEATKSIQPATVPVIRTSMPVPSQSGGTSADQ